MTTESQAPAAPSEPAAEVTAPAPPQAQAAPSMTEASAIAELHDWMQRVEKANLSPVAIATRVIFRRGVGILDGFLAGVEGSLSAGKKG